MDVGGWTLNSALVLALLHGAAGDGDELVLLVVGLAVGIAVFMLSSRPRGGKGKGSGGRR
ncbi:MAG: hypothetical protein HY690_08175 [Chloroflexi bacterium]|nr:hypothetical protein [Chloroflexota bacterium]